MQWLRVTGERAVIEIMFVFDITICMHGRRTFCDAASANHFKVPAFSVNVDMPTVGGEGGGSTYPTIVASTSPCPMIAMTSVPRIRALVSGGLFPNMSPWYVWHSK